MMRLFWKLFGVFCLAFIAIDFSHSAALQWLQQLDTVALDVAVTGSRHDVIANTVASYTNALVSYGAAFMMALCLSALLAWYLHQPVRIMRSAFSAMSEGKLDTRVEHLMGSRRGGIADLGRDFDGMAHRLETLIGIQQRTLQEVSHELRSPLTRLQTAIGLAQQNPHNIHATLDRIENESLRLQSMLENMLILAHMETGGNLPPASAVDVMELLDGIARDANFEAQAQGCELIFRAQGECVSIVHAELLYRAFENVIRNAVKYTAPASAVEIDVEYTESQLRISVADRGPGVTVDALSKIFEPFYRVPEQQRQTQGFGLGLAIARSAIEFHGGSIEACNRRGAGLRVVIVLPR